MKDIRLVAFDWGGVILRICRSWAEGCAAARLPAHAETLTPEMKTKRKALAERYHVGEIDCDDFFRLASGLTGGLYTPSQVRTIHDAWLLAEYPGAAELIGELRAKSSAQTLLLSNTNESHWVRHLPKVGGAAGDFPAVMQLHHRLASHVLKMAKPGREIYLAAERQTGVRGEHVLFFDDLIENVEAARAVGWRAEQIDHLGDTAAQMRGHLRAYGVM
jgi:FMN phosphatase YigB (HAD superfamily)